MNNTNEMKLSVSWSIRGTFCFNLLEKGHVALTPGLSFGDAFDGYIRLAMTMLSSVKECTGYGTF